jgi:hypothetical protein
MKLFNWVAPKLDDRTNPQPGPGVLLALSREEVPDDGTDLRRTRGEGFVQPEWPVIICVHYAELPVEYLILSLAFKDLS